jgi:predicted dehydrogenase
MRVAIIGASHWHANMHLRSLQLAEDVQIVGVSDQRIEAAEALTARAGGAVYADYRDMLDSTAPEFVVALGRPVDMPVIGRYLINAGIPCAIEKPVGTSAADIAPLVKMAQERQAFVAVPFTNRYSTMWNVLDHLERAGRVGTRAHAHFRIINGPPNRYEQDGVGWILDPAVSGGGSLRNLGIHAADAFLQYVTGEAVEVIGAVVSYHIHDQDVEELGAAILRSESGVVGTIEAGYIYASMVKGDFEGRITAANCTIIDKGESLTVATLDDANLEEMIIPNQAARYDQFCVDSLERLQDGRKPIANIEDCYRAMLLIDEVYDKAIRNPVQKE